MLVHARALLTSSPQGATDYLDADIRDPDTILDKASATLDFSTPVAVTSLMTFQFITENEEAYQVVSRFVGPLPPGGLPGRLRPHRR